PLARALPADLLRDRNDAGELPDPDGPQEGPGRPGRHDRARAAHSVAAAGAARPRAIAARSSATSQRTTTSHQATLRTTLIARWLTAVSQAGEPMISGCPAE